MLLIFGLFVLIILLAVSKGVRIYPGILDIFCYSSYYSGGTVWYVDVELTFRLSLALSEIILLLGGDIEKNPGPLTGEELAKVDTRCLSKDDLGIVYQAVLSLADDCHRLCLFLGIPKSKIDAIKQSYPAHVHEWLIEGLSEWLRSNHNTDKYGQPSWRTLIKCIGNIDCELARSLAKEHEVSDTGPQQEGVCCCACREFNRSADFSDLFSEISTHLMSDLPDANVNKLKIFLRYFCHPLNPSKGQYVEPEIYRTATSTKDILDALFDDKYISPTNPHLLGRIIKKFGCQKCKETLQQYTEKYPSCTCNSY